MDYVEEINCDAPRTPTERGQERLLGMEACWGIWTVSVEAAKTRASRSSQIRNSVHSNVPGGSGSPGTCSERRWDRLKTYRARSAEQAECPMLLGSSAHFQRIRA